MHAQNEERRAVQGGIFDFQRQWNRYAEDALWPRLSGRSARERLAAIVVAALKAPTPAESTYGTLVKSRTRPFKALARTRF